jgi:hypothetical protein
MENIADGNKGLREEEVVLWEVVLWGNDGDVFVGSHTLRWGSFFQIIMSVTNKWGIKIMNCGKEVWVRKMYVLIGLRYHTRFLAHIHYLPLRFLQIPW